MTEYKKLNSDIEPLSETEIDEVSGGVLGFVIGLAIGLAIGTTGVILEETKPWSGTLKGKLHY